MKIGKLGLLIAALLFTVLIGAVCNEPPTISAPPPPPPPTAPNNVTARPAPDSIELAWQSTDRRYTVRLERRGLPNEPWQPVATLGSDVTTFSDYNIRPGVTYHYRACAFDNEGNNACSIDVAATAMRPLPPPRLPPPPRKDPPSAPSSLLARAEGFDRVRLSWRDNSVVEDGFEIYRRIGNGPWEMIDTTDPSQTEYLDRRVQPNTPYTYRVRAFNSAGPSAFTAMVSVRTMAPPPPPPPMRLPAPPRNVQVDAVGNHIRVTWEVGSPNTDGYRLERKAQGQRNYQTLADLDANQTLYQDRNVDPGVTYYYRLSAANGAGFSNYSIEAWATARGATPPPPPPPGPGPGPGPGPQPPPPPPPRLPAPPRNVQVDAVGNIIRVTWEAGSPNAESYRLERKVEGQRNYEALVNLDGNLTQYQDRNVQPTTTYYYRLTAKNADGTSAYSNEAWATTRGATPPPPPPPGPGPGPHPEPGPQPQPPPSQPQAPVAPAGLTAKPIHDSMIKLTWTDKSNDEDGFRIVRQMKDGEWNVVAEVGPNVKSYTDNGLKPKTTYRYRIQAFNEQGVSESPEPATATTPGRKPGREGD